ncbi:DUF5302 domain-containing protein [Streptomyces sp. NPDC058297]|uniref:DUF5302 domain-containing protein n=1 Tax=unclassified Streptomyces TaxID=2593676 RepID=UPI0036EC1FCB
MAAESASQEGSEPAEAEKEGLAPDDEGQYDLKRKFREALDRKRGMQADTAGGAAKTGSKIRGAHGPASSQKSFRRKSGG